MADQPLHLTDGELIARLTQIEDSFVERKSQSDKAGWLRTTVAFANSTPVGLPAVLFIGVNDDGTIEDGVNVERTMQTFSDFVASHAWPPIFTIPRTITHGSRPCVAVIVPGSPEGPHFAGRSYVRVGTQTKEASSAQFAELIAVHSSKAREIQRWKDKDVSWVNRDPKIGESHGSGRTIVRSCNSYYATFEMRDSSGGSLELRSESLSRLEISYDHRRDRLQVVLYTDR